MLFQRVPEAHHAAKEDTGDDFLMPQKLSSAKEDKDKDPGANVQRVLIEDPVHIQSRIEDRRWQRRPLGSGKSQIGKEAST